MFHSYVSLTEGSSWIKLMDTQTSLDVRSSWGFNQPLHKWSPIIQMDRIRPYWISLLVVWGWLISPIRKHLGLSQNGVYHQVTILYRRGNFGLKRWNLGVFQDVQTNYDKWIQMVSTVTVTCSNGYSYKPILSGCCWFIDVRKPPTWWINHKWYVVVSPNVMTQMMLIIYSTGTHYSWCLLSIRQCRGCRVIISWNSHNPIKNPIENPINKIPLTKSH